MFDIAGPRALEIVIRVCCVFLACIAMLRLSGRREMSELSPLDLLAMLLLSETVSPALTGGDESITGGLIAAATLIGLTVISAWLSFRYRTVEKLMQGEAVIVIENGKARRDILRRYRITNDALDSALHQNGLVHLDQVKRGYVESDGEITLIKQDDWHAWQRARAARLDQRAARGTAPNATTR